MSGILKFLLLEVANAKVRADRAGKYLDLSICFARLKAVRRGEVVHSKRYKD